MGGGIMNDEVKAEILDCMEWDRVRIDELRVSEAMSDHAAAVLQAIREHSDQYTAIIKAF